MRQAPPESVINICRSGRQSPVRDFTTSNLANTCGATNRPTRVAFVLASNSRSPLPSTRIAVLNMLPFLGAAGFEPEIVFEPEQPNMSPIVDGLEHRLVAEGFGIVFLQKVRAQIFRPVLPYSAGRWS